MTTNEKTLEKRLAEFTEVHGTVLLGMHRELQGQLDTIDKKLDGEFQKLREYAESSEADLQEKSEKLKSDLDDFRRYSQEEKSRAEAHYKQLQSLIESQKKEFKEFVQATQISVYEIVAKVKGDADRSLKDVQSGFEKSHDAFQTKLKESEAAILNYMQTQQRLFDQQTAELKGLGQDVSQANQQTQKVLAETELKINAHQQREAAFNRKFRQILLSIAAATALGMVLGVWKPWIS